MRIPIAAVCLFCALPAGWLFGNEAAMPTAAADGERFTAGEIASRIVASAAFNKFTVERADSEPSVDLPGASGYRIILDRRYLVEKQQAQMSRRVASLPRDEVAELHERINIVLVSDSVASPEPLLSRIDWTGCESVGPREHALVARGLGYWWFVDAGPYVPAMLARAMGLERNAHRPLTALRAAAETASERSHWLLYQWDDTPSVRIGNAAGYRVVLRHVYSEFSTTSQSGRLGLYDARSSRCEYIDMVLFPESAEAPDTAGAIPWLPLEEERERYWRAVYMGRGYGFHWFTETTVERQDELRQALSLEGGEDQTALLVEGLTVRDEITPSRCARLLAARLGEGAVPYFEQIEEKAARDGKRREYSLYLREVQGRKATEYLVRHYLDEPSSSYAGRALAGKPYREQAKKAYLEMLRRRDREYVAAACEACAEFGWTDALPLVKSISAEPEHWRHYASAFAAERRLSGRPVPEELERARYILQRAGGYEPWPPDGKQAPTEEEVEQAKRAFRETADREAAIVMAVDIAFPDMAKPFWNVISQTSATAREVLAALEGEATSEMVAGLASRVKANDDKSRIGLLLSK